MTIYIPIVTLIGAINRWGRINILIDFVNPCIREIYLPYYEYNINLLSWDSVSTLTAMGQQIEREGYYL